jgi:hypothetical protein
MGYKQRTNPMMYPTATALRSIGRRAWITIFALLTTAPGARAGPTRYVATDLNAAGMISSSAAGAAAGQQVGSAAFPDFAAGSHAFLWTGTPESFVDLHPAGFANSDGLGIAAGQQVGRGIPNGQQNHHALLWRGTAQSVVDLHPANAGLSEALGTDGTHQIGSAAGPELDSLPHAILWSGTAESALDLNPTALGFTASSGSAVRGDQQVGNGGGPTFVGHAMLWRSTPESAVDLHPEGFDFSLAVALSQTQQVGSGFPTGGPGRHALLWSGTADSVVDLHPAGYSMSFATGVADGVQVGFAGRAGGVTHALAWSGSADDFVNLHAFLVGDYEYSQAFGIDEAGNIVGLAGLRTGPGAADVEAHAIIWRPAEGPPPMPIPLPPAAMAGLPVIAVALLAARGGAMRLDAIKHHLARALACAHPGTAARSARPDRAGA